MPREVFGPDHVFLPRHALLTFEEITHLARIGTRLGVRKIRLTGGEPLMRRGITELVSQLSALRDPEGRPLDLAMTTNGSLLAGRAAALREAGLDRVTISLDSLDPEQFGRVADVRLPLGRVLDGIAAAADAGLGVKINTVLQRGINEDQILPLVERFRFTGHTIRFIEFMDVGASNGWELDQVVPSAEVVDRINARYPLEPVAPTNIHDTARRWRFLDGGGEIGTISSVTRAFCGDCSRARISAEGTLFTCLFASTGTDLRALMRGGEVHHGDEDPATRAPLSPEVETEVTAALRGVWSARTDNYSEQRSSLTDHGGPRPGRIEMSYIGG
jgi:cyclic pyranopterin phosphate synthase